MQREMIEVLTCRIRVLAMNQIVRVYFDGEYAPARSCVDALEVSKLLERKSVLARPLLALDAPVISWQPNSTMPDFGGAAYKLKTRWREPVEPVEILQASRSARKEFGGVLGGRWPRTSEITHDLHLAEIFLKLAGKQPDLVHGWIPEAQLYAEGRGHRERLPDVVVRVDGVDSRVIEFGGSYGKQKLQTFHAQVNSLPYEVW